jgi:hypothetical protein
MIATEGLSDGIGRASFGDHGLQIINPAIIKAMIAKAGKNIFFRLSETVISFEVIGFLFGISL